MKQLFIPVLILLTGIFSFAQNTLTPVESHIDDAFHLMWLTNEQIKNNDLQNEQILNLVNVHLTDSILKKKTQYHRALAAGWILNALGINWYSVTGKKEKFVGTAYHNIAVSDKELFTEYDLNIDLFAHIPEFYEKSVTCYAAMKRKARRLPDSEFEKPQYAPASPSNLDKLRMHCEHTPDKLTREIMNDAFLPTEGEYNFANHPKFLDPNPTLWLS